MLNICNSREADVFTKFCTEQRFKESLNLTYFAVAKTNWVRLVKEQAYGGITPELGYGGHDEDQGQMGGVSALMAIGLFNIVGTESITPFYEITSPIFDKVTIKLDNKYYKGKKFVIKTNSNSKENCYIQKARLNGKPLDNFWFTHRQFAAGGELELWLGNEPNKEWGMKKFPPVM